MLVKSVELSLTVRDPRISMSRPIPSSWKAAGILVFVLAIWMISGLFTSDDSSSSDDATESNLPMAVEVTMAKSTLMSRELDLRGQLDPLRQVMIRAQTGGEVQEILTNKGQRVSAEQTLVKLEEGGRSNQLAEANAAVKSARSEQQAAQSLQRQRLQSQVQLEQANAVLEAALARLAGVELDIDKTNVTAPFSGVINDLPVELGTLIENGDLIAHLVDDSAFKVSVRVSQQGLSQLSVGQPVTVSLITGQTLQGTVSFIGSVADPQTRSFAVEAVVQNTDNTVAAGVSASMSIAVEEVIATFVSPATLSLGEDGALGVKAVDDQDEVTFLPIELISSALDGAWVTGIPSQTRVITRGQGFVNTGEKVRTQVAGTNQ